MSGLMRRRREGRRRGSARREDERARRDERGGTHEVGVAAAERTKRGRHGGLRGGGLRESCRGQEETPRRANHRVGHSTHTHLPLGGQGGPRSLAVGTHRAAPEAIPAAPLAPHAQGTRLSFPCRPLCLLIDSSTQTRGKHAGALQASSPRRLCGSSLSSHRSRHRLSCLSALAPSLFSGPRLLSVHNSRSDLEGDGSLQTGPGRETDW